ncbi:hypothetical protein [Paraburkholderia sp. BCC1886]|uniref:hypothetical protein n=1 Tax=Paraburkholderia sp. BCC1886 TaxID=2562670 RepID=UPI001182E334|nr:hypothetical protein [Paraburkholderia sp. BCC1886]
MNEYPVTDTLLLDPLPVAAVLEAVIGDFLTEPASGVYIKGRFDPVMVPGGVYHQRDPNIFKGSGLEERVVVTSIDHIDKTAPVLDLDANVAITVSQMRFLSSRPTLPGRGVAIIKRCIGDLLCHYGDKRENPPVVSTPALYGEFLKPEFREEPEVYEQILGVLLPIESQVREFLGHDHWVVHFLRQDRFSLYVEKSLDYRIIEWHQQNKVPYRS